MQWHSSFWGHYNIRDNAVRIKYMVLCYCYYYSDYSVSHTQFYNTLYAVIFLLCYVIKNEVK